MDRTATVYLIIIVSQIGIFSMCLYWWAKYRKASTIFKCFTLLSLGIIAAKIPLLLGRVGIVKLDEVVRSSWWWEGRLIPIAIASIIIFAIFAHRLLLGEGPGE